MRRFFVDKILSEGQTVSLTGNEARHILTVLRMKTGDKLILINGTGNELIAQIASVDKDKNEVELLITDETFCTAEPTVDVTLFQCLPKSGKPEFIIQKCVELGISSIQPVYSKRCVVKPDKKDNTGKIARYNRIAQEAAKQCKRGTVPEVRNIINLNGCDFSEFELILIAYEDEEKQTLKAVLKSNPDVKSIALLIGPEGGFESSEVEKLLSEYKNAYPVSLGKRILRTETAGMAALAMIIYEYEQ